LPGIRQLFLRCSTSGIHAVAMPGKSVRQGRAFRQGILPWRKGVDIPVDSPAGLSSPLTAAQGPWVEQRAILARTRYATAAQWRKPKSQEREIPLRAGFSKVAKVSIRPKSAGDFFKLGAISLPFG